LALSQALRQVNCAIHSNNSLRLPKLTEQRIESTTYPKTSQPLHPALSPEAVERVLGLALNKHLFVLSSTH
jgi:hypothetical protein